jgi:uncharacterized integral membrane protein
MADPQPPTTTVASTGGTSSRQRRGLIIRLVTAAVLVILLVIFIVQNRASKTLHLLWAELSAPLWLLLLICAALGFLLGFLLAAYRRSRRSR